MSKNKQKHTKMSESSGTSNTMQISFRIFWEIKVDDHIDSLDIDTTSEKI